MKDMIVIGGGAGGIAAAVRASQLGAKVAVIEKENLGGVCMNRGCIPTKALLSSAILYRNIQRAELFGLKVEKVAIDMDRMMKRKDDLVQYLRMGAVAILRSNGVEIVQGEAQLLAPDTVQVGKTKLKARTFVIATGSTWQKPSIKGIDGKGMVTSDEVLEMKRVPARIAVIGGGHLEVEFAQYFQLMGSEVTLIEEGRRILPEWDREVSQRLNNVLRDQGIRIKRRARVRTIRKKGKGLEVLCETTEGEESTGSEMVLFLGRRPDLDRLGLDRAGVKLGDHGVLVDETLKTSQPNIYAVGDALGQPMYSHRASSQGLIAAGNALGKKEAFQEHGVPRGIYTYPEAASVGMTEKEAKDKGLELQIGLIPYSVNSRAMIEMETDGSVKVIADSRYGEILGVHMVGPYSTEMITSAALAIQMEATVEELARAIPLHPSLSESHLDACRESMGQGIYILRK